VGEGVPTSRIGERVWLYETQRQRGFGTAAGFAVVPSDHAVYLPENTFAEAACWGSRDDSSPLRLCRRFCAGTNYFSDGGAGAVGPATGEMGGATAIATVSRSEQAELVKAAGADHIINYKTEDVVEEITGAADGRELIALWMSTLPLYL